MSESIIHLVGNDHYSSAMLESEGFDVRKFGDFSDFLREADPDKCGCVIVDLEAPNAASGTAPPLLLAAEAPLPTIVMSPKADVALAVRAMKEGAFDFLEKPVERSALLAAVNAALATSRTQLARVRCMQELRARFDTLSAREKEVVDDILSGYGNKEIAERLGISARTVETHRANAMTKLGARTLADLVRAWLYIAPVHAR